MSRVITPFRNFVVDPTPMTILADWAPLRDTLNLLALGGIERNVHAGGSLGFEFGIDASVAGDYDLTPCFPIEFDDTVGQYSASANVIIQFRYFVRVSNAAINVTPKIFDITSGLAATYSGQYACAATNTDYTGLRQQQTILLTPAAAKHSYKPRLTIAGTVAAGLQVWGLAMFDCYVNG